jgi:predicted DNA-binding transcriptional regulator AlpA
MTALALTAPVMLSPVITPNRVLSRREAAARVGLSPAGFDRARRRGDLPQPIRIGRRVLWRPEDLDAALERLTAQ